MIRPGLRVGSLTVNAAAMKRGKVKMWKTICSCGKPTLVPERKLISALTHAFDLRCKPCTKANPGEEKICSKCLLPKPLAEFCTRPSSPDGRRYDCKSCHHPFKPRKETLREKAGVCLVCYDLPHRIIGKVCTGCGERRSLAGR